VGVAEIQESVRMGVVKAELLPQAFFSVTQTQECDHTKQAFRKRTHKVCVLMLLFVLSENFNACMLTIPE
jgi:hypothetical protein